MVQVGSTVIVCDKTGVVSAECIKVLGPMSKKIAYIGDVIIVSVKHINKRKFINVKLSKKKRFFLGTLHRALVVRTKQKFFRSFGLYLAFNENTVVLVNKRTVPISNRIWGPILRELCMKYPSLGCTSRFMI